MQLILKKKKKKKWISKQWRANKLKSFIFPVNKWIIPQALGIMTARTLKKLRQDLGNI